MSSNRYTASQGSSSRQPQYSSRGSTPTSGYSSSSGQYAPGQLFPLASGGGTPASRSSRSPTPNFPPGHFPSPGQGRPGHPYVVWYTGQEPRNIPGRSAAITAVCREAALHLNVTDVMIRGAEHPTVGTSGRPDNPPRHHITVYMWMANGTMAEGHIHIVYAQGSGARRAGDTSRPQRRRPRTNDALLYRWPNHEQGFRMARVQRNECPTTPQNPGLFYEGTSRRIADVRTAVARQTFEEPRRA